MRKLRVNEHYDMVDDLMKIDLGPYYMALACAKEPQKNKFGQSVR